MSTLWIIPCFAGAIGALILALLLAGKRRKRYELGVLMSVMVVIAWIQFSNGLVFIYGGQVSLLGQMTLIGELALPITLYHVGLSFAQQLFRSVDMGRVWRFRVLGLLALGMGILVISSPHLVMSSILESGEIVFIQPAGRVIWSFVLIALVLGLAEFERILKASRDPLRYQLKFILIGLGGIAAFEIVQSSQLLWLPIWKQEYLWVSGIVTVICLGVITLGLGRWRIQELGQKLYLSHQVFYTSFTFLLVGFYLMGVGILAKAIQQTQWALSEALSMLLAFVGGLALVVVLFSRQARAELQVFIARNFYRSKYDYRLQWLQLTEAMSTSHSIDTILDQFLNILSRTFGAARIMIWLECEADKQFHQIRSVNTEPPHESIRATHPIVVALKEKGEPIQLSENSDETQNDLQEFLQMTHAAVCVPLQVSFGQLIGFVTLSRELQGRTYGKDDFDLLRAMAHHVTMVLTKITLMEERTASAKWEAVHRFSAFYLHDLKNLASGLSLVVQNAEVYGHDQEFHKSAIRTIGSTAQRMTGLIDRLSAQSKDAGKESAESFRPMDINVLVRETINSLNGAGGCRLQFMASSDLPCIPVQPEPMKQVLLNLLLNARQATGDQGTIEVKTRREGDLVLISVADKGPGIPASQLYTLFQPFRTTKKGGLGVGLYQCKQIVEQHKGSIQVASQEGQGTEVLISLPVPGKELSPVSR